MVIIIAKLRFDSISLPPFCTVLLYLWIIRISSSVWLSTTTVDVFS